MVRTYEVCRQNESDNRCNAQNMTYESVSELCRYFVCTKQPSFEWHNHTFLLRIYKVCPQALFCRQDLDVDNYHIMK